MSHNDVFMENYGDESEDEVEETEDMADATREDSSVAMLDITVSQANKNYNWAGIEVDEEEESITLAKNAHLIDTETESILDSIVDKIQLKYKPAQFQRVAINALASLKNVILLSPTGSGKMSIPLLTTLVLRRKLKNPKGVCIVTQESISNVLFPIMRT